MASERWLCPSCGATSDPAPEPPPGCSGCDAPLHVGKFGLLAEIEPDRSARVFRGRESSGRTDVIVRIFPENLGLDASLIRQAVKRASALSHPVIAPPLDAGTYRKQAYFVETAVPGVPITNADLPLREAVSMMRIVALALDHAHGKGVCHPDLRAGDIRVLRAGRTPATTTGWKVSVTSFGIANGGSVRDNVGAFGRILYAMATGRSPRDWATLAPSTVNPLVDSELEAIILLAMDSAASGQPPSMDVIAAELGRWLDGGAKAGAAPNTAAPPPPKFRHPWKAYVKLGAAAAAVVLLLVLVIRGGDRPIEPDPVARPAVEAPPPEQIPPKLAEAPRPVVAPPPAPVEPPAPKPEPAPPVVEPRPKPPEEKPEPVKPAPPPPEPVKPPPPPPEPPKPTPPPAPIKPPEEKPAPPPPPPPPPPAPAPAPVPPPPPPAPAPVAGLGEIFRIHPQEGTFVKLSGTSMPAKGETLEAVRKGKVVAKLRVRELTPSERRYPKGCAVCEVTSGTPAEGDVVRKGSP